MGKGLGLDERQEAGWRNELMHRHTTLTSHEQRPGSVVVAPHACPPQRSEPVRPPPLAQPRKGPKSCLYGDDGMGRGCA